MRAGRVSKSKNLIISVVNNKNIQNSIYWDRYKNFLHNKKSSNNDDLNLISLYKREPNKLIKI